MSGLAVLEMAGLGPVPFAGLMLSELGARVIRVEAQGRQDLFSLPPQCNLDRHGREILRVDLKNPAGLGLLMALIPRIDILIEGYRPGVMERLGIGPDHLCSHNPHLIYGRMTGFGQEGPLAPRSGHDLTYLAYTGILNAVGHTGSRPVPPLNLIGDYGGGTMFLLVGVLAALHERTHSGKGQVIDAAMIDGASMLAATLFGYMAGGLWKDRRGENLLDSGCPFYDTYETADGRHVAVACLEPQFFAEFARLLPIDPGFAAKQYDRSCWPDMREAIATRLKEQSRDDWATVFDGSDACVAPVLSFEEAVSHPHNVSRGLHATNSGFVRPAPAPRFSRSVSRMARTDSTNDPRVTLATLGIGREEADALFSAGVIG